MNATNRFMNRLGLFIIGALFLAVGAAVTAAALVPQWSTWWTDGGNAARTWLDQNIANTRIGDTTLSWVAVITLLILVILIVLLILALTRLGGGRTSTLLSTSQGAGDHNGTIIVDSSFTSDALGHTLNNRPNVLSSNVNAHRINKTPVMQVNVTPRQNTSPLEVARDVDRLLENLTTLTGEAIPTYLSIHSGLRSRLARDKGLA